jgi:alpha-ribazole phosphatase/probable phosphoglycerate mutase
VENNIIKTRLYLVRHGESKNYLDDRNAGQWDVDLTQNGFDQIEKLAERLKNEHIYAIISSDLKRAKKSAEIIAFFHKLEVISFKELREINIGEWEGMKFSDIFERSPELKFLKKNPDDLIEFRIPGGESFHELGNRVIKQFEKIIKEMKGKNFLIVGHKLVNQFIISHALGLKLKFFSRIEQDFGCLNLIDYFDDSPIVQLING